MRLQLLIAISIYFVLQVAAQQKGVTQLATNLSAGQAGNQQLTSKTYAVVVGISDYQDPSIPDLRYADKDAEAFANFLRSEAGGKLDGDHLKMLINSEATMAQFAIALDWLLEVAKENDQIFLYFSGHGDVEKKTVTQPGYLLCWDAPARVYLAGGALALPMFQDVVTTLSTVNKSKVTIIADACRSGKLSGSTVGGAQITGANLARQYSNEIKILSCQPHEYSIEGEQWGGGRGVFSYHLIEALYGLADQNSDLTVTLGEISRYLEDHVTLEVAPQKQEPVIVGVKAEKLTTVYPEVLAEIKKAKLGSLSVFAAIETRGMEEEILTRVDSSLQKAYSNFKARILQKQFLQPVGDCADHYYKILSENIAFRDLHSTLKRNYAAALQDDAQQQLNTMLKTGLTNEYVSGKHSSEIYGHYPDLLTRAAELLGTEHYMHRTLLARKAFFEGKIQKKKNDSKKYYHQALSYQPEMPHAMAELILTFSSEERDSADYYADLAMKLVPQWIIPYIKLAHYYSVKLKDKVIPERLLNQAGELDPNSELVWYYKGRYYKDIGAYQEATYWLEKAVSTSSVDFCFNCALAELGNLYIDTKQFDKAEPLLLKAVELDPSFKSTLNRLGKVYWNIGKFEESEKIFQKEIQMAKSEKEKCMAFNELGNLYLTKGNKSMAEAFYLKSLAADTTNPNPYINLGYMYLGRNQMDSVKYCAKKLENIFPMLAMQLHVEISKKENRMDDALQLAFRLKNEYPEVENQYVYVCLLAMNGKTEEAYLELVRLLEKGFDFDWLQNDPDLHELRAQEVRWKELMKKYFPSKFKG